MPEKPSHKRAKRKAAGKRGKTEVPLSRRRRLDAKKKVRGAFRAEEIQRAGSRKAFLDAARRLRDSRSKIKILRTRQIKNGLEPIIKEKKVS
ncbi:hypothetical protein ES703_69844 [subsurface metagenome]